MLIDDKPILTNAPGGYYSTIVRPDKMVETMWFGNDGTEKCVGISDIRLIAARHIEDHKQSL